MSKELKKRNDIIIKLASNGKSLESIGLKFDITKQRVQQIVKKHDKSISPRNIRRKIRVTSTINDYNNGLPVHKIREKYNLNQYDINNLLMIGVDLRLVKPEIIHIRNLICKKLYKQGLTAYEIIDKVTDKYPIIKTPNDVYRLVAKVNNGILPKRVNNRSKDSIKLSNKIKKLKKKHTFNEVLKIMSEDGIKNLNGGDLKLQTIINHYYRK